MVLLQAMQMWCRLLKLGVRLVGLLLQFVLVWLLLLLVLEQVVVRFQRLVGLVCLDVQDSRGVGFQ